MNQTICVIDDDSDLADLLSSALRGARYEVIAFSQASEFFDWLENRRGSCGLVISDVTMPGINGYQLCKAIRRMKLGDRIPIILITGDAGEEEKTLGIEVGADDLIPKPFSIRELLAKVKSLLEIHDQDRTVRSQLKQAANFLSPNVAEMLASGNQTSKLDPHRAEVSVLFADIRGFTAFAEKVQPDEVMQTLSDYYRVVGEAALRNHGTLGALAGDGVMIFFNDPEPIEHHQEAAVQTALEIREALNRQKSKWTKLGYGIDFGMGIAQGRATIGRIGFDRYWQYSVIGPVTNLAARLCQKAGPGQILVSQRFLSRVRKSCHVESMGPFSFKGIEGTVEVNNVISISDQATAPLSESMIRIIASR